MKTILLGNSNLQTSRLAYGCMRIAGDGSRADRKKGKQAILAAFDAGFSIFDHADIYGGGACEAIFGDVLRESSGLRRQIVLASKCGIRAAGDPDEDAPARYDFSLEHIVRSVEASLQRLGVEHIDLLMLHRPDYLMRASEVAEALSSLKSSGKVRYFGVSNFTVSQVELLLSVFPEPLLVNQIEINLQNMEALSNGVLEQCQQLGITPQAWSPIAGVAGESRGNLLSVDEQARVQKELQRQSVKYDTDNWLVALAWLLKHPAQISPIIGSTDPERIAMSNAALDIPYSREDWYSLLEARNGAAVP